MQFRNSKQLNHIIDQELPPRPEFVRRTYKLGGEKHEMYMRDSLEVLKELYGRPDLANDMVFAPEKHYVRKGEGEQRTISDMHTARWWWQMQVRTNCIRSILFRANYAHRSA